MSDSLATLNTEGDVSVITLNDGKVNVFSLEMIDQLNSLLDQVPEDKGSLLIKGKEGIFSAGFDLKVMQGGDPESMAKLGSGGFHLLSRVFSSSAIGAHLYNDNALGLKGRSL